MSALEPYKPIPGYAPLGGRASFRAEDGRCALPWMHKVNETSDLKSSELSTMLGRLKTVFMSYNGSNYTSFEVQGVLTRQMFRILKAFRRSRRN